MTAHFLRFLTCSLGLGVDSVREYKVAFWLGVGEAGPHAAKLSGNDLSRQLPDDSAFGAFLRRKGIEPTTLTTRLAAAPRHAPPLVPALARVVAYRSTVLAVLFQVRILMFVFLIPLVRANRCVIFICPVPLSFPIRRPVSFERC